MYAVYEHVNKINGKRYIGITSNDVKIRWKKGFGYSSKLPIGRALRKYGWDNFEHNVLYEGLTEGDAKRVEMELIAAYKTQSDDHGYNITVGGDGVCGWHPTEETRKKISESAKRRTKDKNPNFGNTWTDEMRSRASIAHKRENLSSETLQKMSASAKRRYGESNPFYGKSHSDATKELLSKMRRRAVIQLDAAMNVCGRYDSIKAASEHTGVNKVAISNCCRGITRTSGGFIWKYDE